MDLFGNIKINNLIINKMDEFLKPNAAYERLMVEYKKYGSLIVAVDFDSTLYDFHGTGGSYELVRQLVRDLHAANCHIIIWTGNQNTEFVKSFLAENNIPYHGINEDSPEGIQYTNGNLPRKIYANVYIDDRGGLEQVYHDLKKLLYNVNKKTFYRVCNEDTGQGLWYDEQGNFTGLIHDEFSFCKNRNLEMDFDSELVGWLSTTDNLESLYEWFTKEDIIKLQKEGWFIYKYEADEYKFYDKFQHFVINESSSKRREKIVISEYNERV